jgi:photosystem II stability/assembly factor-like uncharacterized protein
MKKSLLILILILGGHSEVFGQWVQTNGPYQGYIHVLYASGSNIFAGNYIVGVFLSTNNGLNWIGVDSGMEATNVYSFAESGGNFIAGTDAGAFLSTDAGTSWKKDNTGLPLNVLIAALTVNGTNLFAGTDSGVFLSTDNGISWMPSSNGLTSIDVQALAIIGTNIFAGTDNGVFLTTNSGNSWAARSAGLTNANINSLAGNDTILFAATGGGVLFSTDSGANWMATDLTNAFVTSLAVSGANLFAGTDGGGVYQSSNGTNWNQVNNGLPTGTFVKTILADSGIIFAGTIGGIYRSTNKGSDWTEVGLSISSVPTLAINGASLFAGTAGYGIFVSMDNGTNWSALNNGLNGYALDVESLADNGTSIFAGTGDGLLLSKNEGESWSQVSSTLEGSTVQAIERFGANLFVGTAYQLILRSTDNGANWEEASSGLTESNISSFASLGSILFTGTNNEQNYGNGVFLSTDSGITWKESPLNNNWITSLAEYNGNLFAGTNLNNPGIFLSTDSGTTWNEADAGLTNPDVNTLLVIGTNVFAGTDAGVFVSSDNGSSWRGVNSGLTAPILSLTFNDSMLFAGTTEDGIWRRPLSEMINTSAVATQAPMQNSLTTYPNPLSQSTTIEFTLPESSVARVTVVNLLGEEVARVFEGALPSGEHSFLWSKPTGLPSGMYECVVEMNGSIQQVPVVITH